MYVNISIMKPNMGHEADTVDSMHRFGAAAETQPGLKLVKTLRDRASGDLVGLAIWESEEAAQAAGPALMAAVENDDFGTRLGEMTNYRVEVV